MLLPLEHFTAGLWNLEAFAAHYSMSFKSFPSFYDSVYEVSSEALHESEKTPREYVAFTVWPEYAMQENLAKLLLSRKGKRCKRIINCELFLFGENPQKTFHSNILECI